MSLNYYDLPLFKEKKTIDFSQKKSHDSYLNANFTQKQADILRQFHIGTYHLSGTTYLMPEFLVSDEAQCSLNYPQGFCIMEADSDYYTKRSSLPSYELRFTLKGQGNLSYCEQSYDLYPGIGFFIDCNKPHEYHTVGNHWDCTIFHLNGPTVALIFKKLLQTGSVIFSSKDCPNFEMLQFEVLKSTQRILPYSEYRTSSLINILLTEILTSCPIKNSVTKNYLGKDTSHEELFTDIINWIQQHFAEPITLEMLNHCFGISRTILCRDFKTYTGFTIHKYILALRLSYAKRLLRSSKLSIESISEQSGFNDCAYFIQIFKKETGMTPLKYRNS